MEQHVITVFEIKHSNGEVQTLHVTDEPGQDAATSAFNTAKNYSTKSIAKLKGFLINGIFKAVDLRDHFQRMAARNRH